MPAATKPPAESLQVPPSGSAASARLWRTAKGQAGTQQGRPANMQQIGNRNFFRRNGQWVDSQVTGQQAANARRIKQFSDEYFKLAEAHGRQLLAVHGLRRAGAAEPRRSDVLDRAVRVGPVCRTGPRGVKTVP